MIDRPIRQEDRQQNQDWLTLYQHHQESQQDKEYEKGDPGGIWQPCG
ncbi:hypothetical protein [Dictyobacter arantiisoli]|nr:hypothetical protein [Dictyobacter arantiisoli]